MASIKVGDNIIEVKFRQSFEAEKLSRLTHQSVCRKTKLIKLSRSVLKLIPSRSFQAKVFNTIKHVLNGAKEQKGKTLVGVRIEDNNGQISVHTSYCNTEGSEPTCEPTTEEPSFVSNLNVDFKIRVK